MTDEAGHWPEWPTGLEQLDIILLFSPDEIRYDTLVQGLKGKRGARLTEDRLHAVLRGPTRLPDIHGHLVTRTADEFVEIELGLYPGRAKRGETVLALDSLPSLIGRAVVDPAAPHDAMVLSTLRLPTDHWSATVPLPVTLPGMLDSMYGSPEISGFSFYFRDESSRIRRAEIDLFERIGEYMLRLQLSTALTPVGSIFARALSETAEDAAQFIRPRTTASPKTHE